MSEGFEGGTVVGELTVRVGVSTDEDSEGSDVPDLGEREKGKGGGQFGEGEGERKEEMRGRRRARRGTDLRHARPSSDRSGAEGGEGSETNGDGLVIVPGELGVIVSEVALRERKA